MKTMLDALEFLREQSRKPGETFHAGARYDALLRLYADDLISVARGAERLLRSQNPVQDLADDADLLRIALAPLLKESSMRNGGCP